MNAHDPIHLEVDTRHGDDGWRWTLRIWKGAVDVRNTPPTRIVESEIACGSARLCYIAALARARTIA